MMWHGTAYAEARLRGADVEPAIHERGIHADDLERHSFGKRERELRLAARGRACQAHAVHAARVAHELLTAQKQPVEILERHGGPRRAAVIARFTALRALHLPQQCVHLVEAEPAI